MKDSTTTIICKGCSKKFRIYRFELYDGDQEYCRDCNKEAKQFAKEVLSQSLVREEMSCLKCGGRLTRERFYTEQGLFDGFRCVICGDVFDDLVLQHRKFQKGGITCLEEEMIFLDQDLVIGAIQKMQK